MGRLHIYKAFEVLYNTPMIEIQINDFSLDPLVLGEMIKLRVAMSKQAIDPAGRCTLMSNALERACSQIDTHEIRALGGCVLDREGSEAKPHTWCETETDTILDITADQFEFGDGTGLQGLKLPAIRVLADDSEEAREYLLGVSGLL